MVGVFSHLEEFSATYSLYKNSLNYSTGHKYCNISTGVLVDFHMIHYTQIIWEEVAFIWKATGKAVVIFMTSTVLDSNTPSYIL